MRVVVLNDYAYINGGASKVAVLEALALAESGIEVDFFCEVGPVDPRLENHKNIHVTLMEGYDLLGDPIRFRAALQGLWNIRAQRSLANLLSSLSPKDTVVHLHGWTKALSSSVIPRVLRQKFPLVCTLHDYFMACPNGGFFLYPEKKICHLKPLSIKCLVKDCDSRSYTYKLWRYVRGWVQKTAGRLPDKQMYFIFVSNFSRSILEPSLPSEISGYLLPNPIGIEQRERVRVEENQAMTFLGRLSFEKAPTQLAYANQDGAFKVRYIGDGECRDAVERICPTADITGWQDAAGVTHYLDQARALIFPSLLYETQGLVVQEAAARGVPAIVADTSAARQMVVDGVTGYWFRSGDVDDLRRKMGLMRDDTRVKQMGKAAYDYYWSSPMTMEKHLGSLLKIYEDALAGRRQF